jgi:hypothetical protein
MRSVPVVRQAYQPPVEGTTGSNRRSKRLLWFGKLTNRLSK